MKINLKLKFDIKKDEKQCALEYSTSFFYKH